MNLATVALMLDVEHLGAYPNLTRHSTGEPLTPEEVAAVGRAGWAEIRAVRDFHALAADAAQETLTAIDRLYSLLRQYGFTPDADVLGGEMEAAMLAEDFAEAQTILRRIQAVTA